MIEGHGDDLHKYGGRIKHNFSTNIHSNFDHSGLKEAISQGFESLMSYPEPEPLSIERKIAGTEGLDPGNVMVTAGATEAIYMTALAFRESTSAIVEPTFREYEDACAIHRHDIRCICTLSGLNDDMDLVWMCNPNNPTGQVTEREYLLNVIRSHPGILFLIDQSYADYSTKPLIRPDEAVASGNVLLLSSMTKRFAVPGLRVGYVVGNGSLLKKIREMRMPWSVSAPAVTAASYLLDHRSDYVIDRDLLHSEALRMADAFRESGIEVIPSDCNFILCELPAGTSASLKEHLVADYGILIRDASNFTGLTERHFRVAAQSPGENDLLIKAVRQWIQSF